MRRSALNRLTIFIIIVVCVAAKLFSEVAFITDDPTVALRLRIEPSFANFVTVSSFEQSGTMILMVDENAFIGQSLYTHFVKWAWLVIVSVCFISLIPSFPRLSG